MLTTGVWNTGIPKLINGIFINFYVKSFYIVLLLFTENY